MNDSWYICKEDTPVKFLWWYDTVAILPEYDDIEDGTLPKDELVKMSGDEYIKGFIVLDLKNHKKLKKSQIPKGRIKEIFIFCRITPLQALVSQQIFDRNFEKYS